MRRCLAVIAVIAIGVAPVFALYPPPLSPTIAKRDQTAQHVSTFRWRHDADWFGGMSGIEITPNGRDFYAVSDRGHVLKGTFTRENGTLTNVEITDAQPLVDKNGAVRKFPHTDAEGLALDAQGRLHVSFEQAHRILRYDTWDSHAVWPSYTKLWRNLRGNGGLEMVAVDAQGVLYAIPESAISGTSEASVYRRIPNQDWDQPFTLPLTPDFAPVGGDIGPDGRLYLLERDFTPYGFRTQVRRMDITPTGFENIEILLQTRRLKHGNVEGLAVGTDPDGKTRLTMISDDNFLPFLHTDIIEYVLQE